MEVPIYSVFIEMSSRFLVAVFICDTPYTDIFEVSSIYIYKLGIHTTKKQSKKTSAHIAQIWEVILVKHRKRCYISWAIGWGLPTAANPLTVAGKYFNTYLHWFCVC